MWNENFNMEDLEILCCYYSSSLATSVVNIELKVIFLKIHLLALFAKFIKKLEKS